MRTHTKWATDTEGPVRLGSDLAAFLVSQTAPMQQHDHPDQSSRLIDSQSKYRFLFTVFLGLRLYKAIALTASSFHCFARFLSMRKLRRSARYLHQARRWEKRASRQDSTRRVSHQRPIELCQHDFTPQIPNAASRIRFRAEPTQASDFCGCKAGKTLTRDIVGTLSGGK